MKRSLLPALFCALLLISPLALRAQAAPLSVSGNPFASLDAQRAAAARLSAGSFQAPGGARGDIPARAKKHYVVQFKSSAPLSSIYRCVRPYGYELLGESSDRLFRVDTDNLSAFEKSCGTLLQSVGSDSLMKLDSASAAVNDPDYSLQWAIPDIKLPDAWSVSRGSRSVKVAVIDSGFARTNGDFSAGTVLAGYDVTAGAAGVSSDPEGHGTAVASIIGAAANNGRGIAGALWNVTIVPYKVVDQSGTIYESSVISAIKMAADAGCSVINMSFGTYYSDSRLQAAVNYAVSRGCILVAAAGNEGDLGNAESGQLSYPASCGGVVSVAAVDSVNRRAYFSQHNGSVLVAAPGENILVDDPSAGSSPTKESGTSFASPYVAAAAALARSVNPNIHAAEFAQLLKESSTDLGAPGRDDEFGYGLLNAAKLVSEAAQPVVCGVENGGVYASRRTITCGGAALTLNGKAFSSGSSVSARGNYTLTAQSGSRRQTLHFSIIPAAASVSGVAEQGDYNHDVAIRYSPGAAALDGVPFASGGTVSAEGSHTLTVRDSAGAVLLTRHFTIDKTAPVVTGAQDGATVEHGTLLAWNEGAATLDGIPVRAPSCFVDTGGSHLLTVTDASGNTTAVHFTIADAPAVKTLQLFSGVSKWTEGDGNLYAILPGKNTLLCIRESDFSVSSTVKLPGAPTDIVYRNSQLYIALDAQHEIVVALAPTGSIIRTIATSSDPYQLAVDDNAIYYAEKDNQCHIYRCSYSGGDTVLPIGTFFEPALAADSAAHRLYIGESGTQGANLFAYDETSGRVVSKSNYAGFGYDSPARSIALYNGDVYYAGSAFDSSLNVLAQFWAPDGSAAAQRVLYAQSGLLFASSESTMDAYDVSTLVKIGSENTDGTVLPAIEGGSLFTCNAESGATTSIQSSGEPVSAANVASLLPFSAAGASQPQPVQAGNGTSLRFSSAVGGMVLDSAHNLLYVTLPAENLLLALNASTLAVEKEINLCNRPTDLLLGDDGRLYVALDGANEIAVFDGTAQAATLQPGLDPWHIAKDGDSIYFVTNENGGWSPIYRYSISSGLTTKVINGFYNNAVLAVNPQSHILYIGETGPSYCALTYFSTVQNAVLSTEDLEYSYGIESADGGIVYDGSQVYFAGLSFRPDRVAVLGGYTGTVLAANGGLVVTPWDVFVRDTDDYATGLAGEARLAQLGGGSLYACSASGTVLTKSGESSLPQLSGITDGGVYANRVTISYNGAYAFLDGIYLPSGSVVSTPGHHTIVVFGGSASVRIASFTIAAGAKLTLSSTSLVIPEGGFGTLSGGLQPSGGPCTIQWSSSDTGVATVDASGRIHGLSVGTVRITATCGDLTASCTVSVVIPAAYVSLNPYYATLTQGQNITLSATVLPDTATVQQVVWASSDPSVATVDSSGVVHAVSPGVTAITATAADGLGAMGICTIIVQAGGTA